MTRLRVTLAALLSTSLVAACARHAEPPTTAAQDNPAAAGSPYATPAPLQAQNDRQPASSDRRQRYEDGQAPSSAAPPRSTRDQPQRRAQQELPRAGRTERHGTIPAGTALTIRLTSAVATATARTGDPVTGELAAPVTENGRDLLPAGTRVQGRVVAATTSGRLSRPASLELDFTKLVLHGGESVSIEAAHYTRVGKSHTGRNAGMIAGGAAVGALVGQLAGKDTDSTLKGAAAGAAAGTGAAAATGELDFTLQPGEEISVSLEQPLRL